MERIRIKMVDESEDLLFRGGFGEVRRATLSPEEHAVAVKSIMIRGSKKQRLAVEKVSDQQRHIL